MIRAEFNGRGWIKRASLGKLFFFVQLLCWGESSAWAAEAVPGEYVVQLRRAVEEKSLSALTAVVGAQVVEKVREDVVLVRAPGGDAGKALGILRAKAMVEVAEPNYIYRINRVPNDPDYERLWGLNNNGNPDSGGVRGVREVDIGAERAWDVTTGSRKVVVAVIDTGVDYTHADLKENAWVNRSEKGGRKGVDDDGNGFVDDIYGYDFANDDADPMDDNGHGTHCSGTIGANGNDGRGVVGVNWRVSIMALKFLSGEGSGTLADAIKAVDYAAKMKVDVMSNSWGGGGASKILEQSIERARDAGILFVAAAGNSTADVDENPEYPASYGVDNIVSVAAVNNRGGLASFSNYGAKSVHIAAPGHNILSTVPGGQDSFSGTSMATPHVAGVAALLLAHDGRLGYRELKQRLMRTGKPLADLRGRVVSGAMVNAYHALTDTPAPPDANDPASWTRRQAETLSSAHPYPDGFKQTWTLHVPGAKRLAVHFARFETEAGFDKLTFTNAKGESVGVFSGRRDDRYSPIVDGDTMELTFTTDSSVNAYGFDIDHIAWE